MNIDTLFIDFTMRGIGPIIFIVVTCCWSWNGSKFLTSYLKVIFLL